MPNDINPGLEGDINFLSPKVNTSKVFSTVGIILTVSILIIGGLWIYLGLNKSVPVDDSSSTTRVTTSSEGLSGTNKEIKAYDSDFDFSTNTGSLHTIKFTSPKNWVLKEDSTKAKEQGHYYTLTSDTNNFEMGFLEIPGGIGGGCPPEDDNKDAIVLTEKITSNGQSLFVKFTGSSAKNQVTLAYLSEDTTFSCGFQNVELKTKSSDPINFYLTMDFQKTVSKEYFLNSAEYKLAKDLIKSLTVEN